MMAKHTESPLGYLGRRVYTTEWDGGSPRCIAVVTDYYVGTKPEEGTPEAEANAAHIVKCWNSHNPMLEALEKADAKLWQWMESTSGFDGSHILSCKSREAMNKLRKELRAAIATAQEAPNE